MEEFEINSTKHVICDLLLNRRTSTWNLFANYNKVGIQRALSLVERTYSIRIQNTELS